MSGCISHFVSGRQAPGYTILWEEPGRVIARLDNGLIAAARRMTAAPVVSAQVWVETGSVYEQEYAGAGISHFLEHLLSGGSTSTRSEKETNDILGRIGAYKNAATGLDSVSYYINTASGHAQTAVDLLSDWMINAVIPAEEFEREREVIQREFSMGEGEPGRILWRLTQQARYTAHPARHPTIGYIDDFLNITREEVIDFYRRMYLPGNMVFSVAGDIDPYEIINRIALRWKDVKPGKLPDISFPKEPVSDSPSELSARADISRPRIRMAWPGTRLGDKDDYALDLLAEILGRGETSRLNREVRDRRQLVTSVSSYNLSFYWGEGFFGVDAEAAVKLNDYDDAVSRAREAVLGAVRRLREENVSREELARAKRGVLSRVMSSNQTVQEVASRMAGDIISTGDPDFLMRYSERIQELTADDLRAAAIRYLLPERLITVKLLPETAEERFKPFRRSPDEAAGSFPAEPVNLDNSRFLDKLKEKPAPGKRKEEVKSGEYRLSRLDNGLRVITQRSTLVPAVSMQLYIKGGLLAETPGSEGKAAAASSMLTRGTVKYPADELSEAIENLGASISASSGYNTDYISAHSLSGDWPEVMELMAEILLRPAFSAEEWDITRPRLIAAIDRQADSWYGELTRSFRRAYFGEHPWSQTSLGRRGVVEELTAEDIRRFHFERLGASDMVLAVAGDADPKEVLRKAKELFGDIPGEAPRRLTLPVPEAPDPDLMRERTAKPVTAVKTGFGPVLEYAGADYPVMQVLAAVISDFPSGWLHQALRGEGRGLVYAAWGRLVTGLVPGYFEITFNTSPGLEDEALERALAVVQRLKDEPLPLKDLERASAKVLFGEFFSRQSNSERAANAALDELYGIGDPEGRIFRKKVTAVKPEDIQESARRYLKQSLTLILSNE